MGSFLQIIETKKLVNGESAKGKKGKKKMCTLKYN